MLINCHEHREELQNQSLVTGEDHIKSSFDFHDTACLFLLGLAAEEMKTLGRLVSKAAFGFARKFSAERIK